MINYNFCKPTVVETVYQRKAYLVATTSVTYFGAVGDGVTDDTDAFLKAIEYTESIGGGAIFVPIGKYVIKKSLTLKQNVSLCGDIVIDVDKGTFDGTVLLSYVGRDDPQGEAFVTLSGDCKLSNLAIYYPEQELNCWFQTMPYSWTIECNNYSSLENVVLVNPYYGIKVGKSMCEMQTLKNVYATPIKLGMTASGICDIAKFINIDFSPKWWLNCEFANSPTEELLRKWLILKAEGFIYERVDWTYIYGITIDGYRIGLHPREVSYEFSGWIDKGSLRAGGEISHAKIINCNTCMYLEAVSGMGIELLDSTLIADGGFNPTAVKTFEDYTEELMLKNCRVKSYGKNAIVNGGSANITLIDVSFYMAGKKPLSAVDMANEGNLSLINCDFKGEGYHVNLENEQIEAKIINTLTEKDLRINCDGNSISYVYDDSVVTINNYFTDYAMVYPTFSATSMLVNICESPYNAASAENIMSAIDISAKIQNAVDDIYASGGGIVYIPVGFYRVEKPVTVKSGVEIRGNSNSVLHAQLGGTVILTAYGEDDETAKPLFTLEGKSGVSGFHLLYDKQYTNGAVEYPYAFCGNGNDVFIKNIHLVNAWLGIDFESNRCDRHYVEGIIGCTFKEGIRIGAGCKDGLIRDIIFNSTQWLHYPVYDWDKIGGWRALEQGIWKYIQSQNRTFVVGDCQNEMFCVNFSYGGFIGLNLCNNSDVKFFGNGYDGFATAVQAEKNAHAEITDIQIALCGAIKGLHFKTTDDFCGDIKWLNGISYGSGTLYAGDLKGKGRIKIENWYPFQCGENQETTVMIDNSDTQILGLTIPHQQNKSDVFITGNVKKGYLYGFLTNKPQTVVNNSCNNNFKVR